MFTYGSLLNCRGRRCSNVIADDKNLRNVRYVWLDAIQNMWLSLALYDWSLITFNFFFYYLDSEEEDDRLSGRKSHESIGGLRETDSTRRPSQDLKNR